VHSGIIIKFEKNEISEISEKKYAHNGSVQIVMQIYETRFFANPLSTLPLQTAGEITPIANAAVNESRNEAEVIT
jgi:hypothetical protein